MFAYYDAHGLPVGAAAAARPAGRGRSCEMRVLIALGGNAMTAADGRARVEDQQAAAVVAMRAVADLIEGGADVVLTHGNGPQVGNLLAEGRDRCRRRAARPLDWCGAQTQATLGYTLMNALENELGGRGVERRTAALVTRALIGADDPALSHPTKPIGTLPPRGRGAPADGARRDLGGPRRQGLAPRRRVPRAARDPGRSRRPDTGRRRVRRVAKTAAAASRRSAMPTGCAASRRSSTRTSAPHSWPGPSTPTSW